MWSLIVPPIIMVLGIAALIYVASRRLPALEERLRLRQAEAVSAAAPEAEGPRAPWWKRLSWSLAEKLASKGRIFFLRLHNWFGRLGTVVRHRRAGTIPPPIPASGELTFRKTEPTEETPTPVAEEEVVQPVPIATEASVVARPAARPKKPAPEPVPPKTHLEEALIERIAANPRDIEAYERLGDYYLERDSLADAKECYRQVLKLSPVNRLVKIKIRRLERLLEKQ